MAYTVRFPISICSGLEKTWRFDELLQNGSTADYLDVQCSIIRQQEPLKDILKDFLKKGDRVLEAGCGSGRWVYYLNKQGYPAVGLDIDPHILKVLRQLDHGLNISVGNVFSLPFAAETFDAVLSLYVLEHFKQGPMLALKEVYRVLKPGGWLFLVVPFNNILRVILFNRLLDLACYYYQGEHGQLAFHEYRYSRKECRRFLVQAGFEPVKFHFDEGLADYNKGIAVDYLNLRFYWPWMPNLSQRYQLPGWLRGFISGLLKVLPWTCCGGVICVARKPRRSQ